MKVSIITVAYNAAATIADTCASVAAQSGVEIEHVVVDGGSRDDTVGRAKANGRADSIIVAEPDNGLYDAMNKGIALATGDIMGFLNADDFSDESLRCCRRRASQSKIPTILAMAHHWFVGSRGPVSKAASSIGWGANLG